MIIDKYLNYELYFIRFEKYLFLRGEATIIA